MIATLQCVVLDCAAPLELARFYEALLGGEVNRPDPRWSLDEDWATLHTGTGFVLAFQRAADHRRLGGRTPTGPSSSTSTWGSRTSTGPRRPR